MTVAAFEHISEAQYRKDALPDSMELNKIPTPRRATPGSAGYDFYSPVNVTIPAGGAVTVPTGMRCRISDGWVLVLFPRSSLGFKYNIRLANTAGVIDSDYYKAQNEGHIMVRLVNGGTEPFGLKQGERFCQGIFLPYGTAEEENVTEERRGGFGSTGA